MKTVAIAGVGLIGASFGLALREAGFTGDVIGVSSPEALEAGLRVGAITHTSSLEEAAHAADVLYLAQPVDRILVLCEQLASLARPGLLITDAGSTKRAIVAKASSALGNSGCEFLGGHPIAGKEQRGAMAAEPGLFRGRPYVLTPHQPTSPVSQKFREWITHIGAHIIEMSAAEHDAALAFTSHLPQVVSTALALTLAREQNARIENVSGPGLLDMIRLAVGATELWNPILSTNRDEVLHALNTYRNALDDLQLALENDRLMELFDVGSNWAKQLRGANASWSSPQKSPSNLYDPIEESKSN